MNVIKASEGFNYESYKYYKYKPSITLSIKGVKSALNEFPLCSRSKNHVENWFKWSQLVLSTELKCDFADFSQMIRTFKWSHLEQSKKRQFDECYLIGYFGNEFLRILIFEQ